MREDLIYGILKIRVPLHSKQRNTSACQDLAKLKKMSNEELHTKLGWNMESTVVHIQWCQCSHQKPHPEIKKRWETKQWINGSVVNFICETKSVGFFTNVQIGNIGIFANFVFSCIYNSLPYLQYIMLVNMKLDISGRNSITFQGYRFHWSSSFLMTQLKWRRQYWHSCIVKSSWKPPVSK